MTDALDRVRAAVAARTDAGLRRVLRPRRVGVDVLDLAGNDYLGLSRDARVIDGAAAAVRTWGAGSTGSRLVTGTTSEHEALEAELAAFLSEPAAAKGTAPTVSPGARGGSAAAKGTAPTVSPGARGGSAAAKGLVFSSGYLANVGVLTALGGSDVTVVSDAGNHASIIDGCRLSGSPVIVVPHRDVDKIDAALGTADTQHALVVTDAIFSVDGDLAPLRELHAVTRRHGAILVVDEAHAMGVVGVGGVGAVSAAGLSGAEDIVRTVTLSKSLGAQGGAVVGAPSVIDLLVNTARPFIFDTGLAPASAAAARVALRVLVDEPERAGRVRHRARQLAAVMQTLGIETVVPDAAIVPAFLGDPRRAVAAAAECLDHGVHVGCFRPPSVPTGRSCLRLTARADLTDDDIERAGSVLRAVLG